MSWIFLHGKYRVGKIDQTKADIWKLSRKDEN